MEPLMWIAVGATAGFLTGRVIEISRISRMGFLVIGVVGAVASGFASSLLFGVPDAMGGFGTTRIYLALLGAGAALSTARAIEGRQVTEVA